jgi:hypothetical protein
MSHVPSCPDGFRRRHLIGCCIAWGHASLVRPVISEAKNRIGKFADVPRDLSGYAHRGGKRVADRPGGEPSDRDHTGSHHRRPAGSAQTQTHQPAAEHRKTTTTTGPKGNTPRCLLLAGWGARLYRQGNADAVRDHGHRLLGPLAQSMSGVFRIRPGGLSWEVC